MITFILGEKISSYTLHLRTSYHSYNQIPSEDEQDNSHFSLHKKMSYSDKSSRLVVQIFRKIASV